MEASPGEAFVAQRGARLFHMPPAEAWAAGRSAAPSSDQDLRLAKLDGTVGGLYHGRMHDVAVVGGGPAGLLTARRCAE